MATLVTTPIKNFVSGETVTPTKLNELSQSTVALTAGSIVAADIADLNVTAGKLANTLDLSGKSVTLADNSIALAKLVTAVQNALLPTGAVSYFARNSAPTGWVLANGGTIGNASSNADLASADGEALFAVLWGNGWTDALLPVLTSGGSASTRGASAAADWAANKRMTLPDLRGLFLRGWGSQTISTVSYSSANFGTKQQDALQGHKHDVSPSTVVITTGGGAYFGSGTASAAATGTGGPVADGANGTPRVATETRSVNISLAACIKL